MGYGWAQPNSLTIFFFSSSSASMTPKVNHSFQPWQRRRNETLLKQNMRFITSISPCSSHTKTSTHVAFFVAPKPIFTPKHPTSLACNRRPNKAILLWNTGNPLSVCDHARILGPVLTAAKKPILSKLNCSCISQLRVLHSKATTEIPIRKTFGAGISRAFLATTSTVNSSLSSIVLRAPSAIMMANNLNHSNAPQKSDEWFALRKDKLTTSTFSTALGFWKGRRSVLWHEKVFAPEVESIAAAARSAMDWGVANESIAIERYKDITGRDVGTLGFAIHAESKLYWLGASPDGLLGPYPGGGVLEVKCPYNKGKPEQAVPWTTVPFYYMPQVQGQMEILDRDWADVYCWTPTGSSIFRVTRHREYWGLINGILHEFWWDNVVPARELLSLGREEDAKAYEPAPTHRLTGLVTVKSMSIAAEAKLICRDIAGQVEYFK